MIKSMGKILTKKDLLTFRGFIQNRTGLFFPESRFYTIEEIINSNFHDSSFTNFPEYILYLKSKNGEGHLKNLTSRLTTNETFFFRGKADFDLLEKHILPELIQKETTSTRTLAIWSAGCSTGEESYSVAILLKKFIPNFKTWNIHIIASDIDESSLQKARKGEYGQWSFRGLQQSIISNCFIKKGTNYLIKEDYKSVVNFICNNLISDPTPEPKNKDKKFDLIICRNVTIYFEKETTKTLAFKFYNILRDGGYLIVGHAEHSSENYAQFKTRAFPDAIVYQKKLEDNPFKPDISLYKSSLSTGKNKKREKDFEMKGADKAVTQQEKGSLKKFIKESKDANLPHQGSHKHINLRKISNEEAKIFNNAMEYYDKKKYELAIDLFLRVLDINSSNARACWMLSHISSNRGYFDEAIEWANRSIKINPLFKEPYYTLSLIHMARGEIEEAKAKIKKAIYIDHNFVLAHFVLGNIYILMKLPERAKKSFKLVKDMLATKPLDEITFQAEHLSVGDLLNSLELKIRKA